MIESLWHRMAEGGIKGCVPGGETQKVLTHSRIPVLVHRNESLVVANWIM